MKRWRTDPGTCPICAAPHCSCGGGGPIEVVQLPARDAAAALENASPAPALCDGSDGKPFSTATYRGVKKQR